MPADDLYGLTGADVDRVSRVLTDFEANRLTQVDTPRSRLARPPIGIMVAKVTEAISARTSTTITLTALNGGIDADDTEIAVDSTDDFYQDGRPFMVTIGDEDLLVTGIYVDGATPMLTVVRAWNDTTAATHADNASITWTRVSIGSGTATICDIVTDPDGNENLIESDREETVYNSGSEDFAVDGYVLISQEQSSGKWLVWKGGGSNYHFAVSITTITAASGSTFGSGLAMLYSAAGGVMTSTGTIVSVLNPCAEIAVDWKLHLHHDPESGELIASPLCEFTEGSGGGGCCGLPSTICVSFDLDTPCYFLSGSSSTASYELTYNATGDHWSYGTYGVDELFLMLFCVGTTSMRLVVYHMPNFTPTAVAQLDFTLDCNDPFPMASATGPLFSYLYCSTDVTATLTSGACGAGSGSGGGACDITVSFDDADLDITATGFYIAGTGFSTTPGDNVVTLNLGAACTVVGATSTLLTVTFTTQPTSTGSLTAIVTVGACDSGAAVQVATVVAVIYGGTGDACTAEEVVLPDVTYTTTLAASSYNWFFIDHPGGTCRVEITSTFGSFSVASYYGGDCAALTLIESTSALPYCLTLTTADFYYFNLSAGGGDPPQATITYYTDGGCPP